MKNSKGFSPLVIIIALTVALGAGIGINFYLYKETKSPRPSAKEEPKDNNKTKPVEETPPSPPKKSPEPIPTPQPTKPKLNCVVGGCNGELCVSADAPPLSSICIYKEEYSCYKTARCELQINGECGWTKTTELNVCIERARNVGIAPAPQPPSPLPPPPPQTQEFKLEADDYGFYPQNTISVAKGTKVTLTFSVRTTGVYYGGLDFRSTKFKTEQVKPGGSTTVEFTADESFAITSYWPLSGVQKSTLKMDVK